MLIFTRILLTLLGIAAIAIGMMVFSIGPHATASLFSEAYAIGLGNAEYSGGLDNINTDSEMRFYSVFWAAFGGILLWLLTDMHRYAKLIFAALGLFFFGGVGRVLSFAQLGAPDQLFVVLMFVEIAGPIVVGFAFLVSLRGRTQ